MPGHLSHSPAEIVRQVLVDLGLCAEPGGVWPAYATSEPPDPDDVATVYNTAGRSLGRTMPDLERQEQHGIQVRVRAGDYRAGFLKARSIAITLDQSVYRRVVVMDVGLAGETSYLLHSVNRSGDVMDLGREVPASKRSLFTINALVSVRQVSPAP